MYLSTSEGSKSKCTPAPQCIVAPGFYGAALRSTVQYNKNRPRTSKFENIHADSVLLFFLPIKIYSVHHGDCCPSQSKTESISSVRHHDASRTVKRSNPMCLSSHMKSADLQIATMFPVNVKDTVTESDSLKSEDMIKRHLGGNGAVCFVVRRPGCQALTKLSANLDGFGMFGLIKETGVDDEGLAEFNQKSFPFPLYRDADRAFYEALGNRKLSLPWNPISMVKEMFFLRNVSKRAREI